MEKGKQIKKWLKFGAIFFLTVGLMIMVLLNVQKHWTSIIVLFNTPVVMQKKIILSDNITEYDKATVDKTIVIVSLITELQPRIDPAVAGLIGKAIVNNSIEFGFPPELITAVIHRESSFNILAVSSAKCLGLMQINPKAHADKIERFGWSYYDLSKIDNNIKLGCMILREYYNSTKSIRKALKRYVGGNEVKYVLDILGVYATSQVEGRKELEIITRVENQLDSQFKEIK